MTNTVKHLPANLFSTQADYAQQRWFAVLPPNIKFEDLFHPMLWAHYARGVFHKHAIVRVVAEDGSFDIDLTVAEVASGGIRMKVRPFFGEASSEAAAVAAKKVAEDARLKVVPIGRDGAPVVRVEFLPATQWRVVGMEGEVSRDHPSEARAQAALERYLADIGMELPSPDEIAASQAAAKEKALAERDASVAAVAASKSKKSKAA
jgi:hypothetical protein